MNEKYKTGKYLIIVGVLIAVFSFIINVILFLLYGMEDFTLIDSSTLDFLYNSTAILLSLIFIGIIIIIVGIILYFINKDRKKNNS